MKMTITRWDTGATIYEAEASSVLELLNLAVKDSANLHRANLDGANLVGANLDRANLDGASLVGASLVGASLDGASLVGASLDGARLDRARLVGASLVGASLVGASLDGARLDRARLVGASLDENTVIETGETWKQYLSEVLPALLTAGGRALAEIATAKHWDCHSWTNCPMAAAFTASGISGVPLLLKPRAEQFIRYFDAKLIPLESILPPAE